MKHSGSSMDEFVSIRNLTFVCHSEEHGDEESPGSEGLGEILRFTQNGTESFPDGN